MELDGLGNLENLLRDLGVLGWNQLAVAIFPTQVDLVAVVFGWVVACSNHDGGATSSRASGKSRHRSRNHLIKQQSR